MNDAIALAEKVLQLLDQGAFTSTYKYAVLLGFLDLVLEKTSPAGEPPDTLRTRDLAENVTHRYWQHSIPYPEGMLVLRQNRSRPGTQAEILRRILDFKAKHDEPIARARLLPGYRRLVDFVEWKLVEMPLPRLQYIGNAHEPFLYDISGDREVRQGEVTAYQREQSTGRPWMGGCVPPSDYASLIRPTALMPPFPFAPSRLLRFLFRALAVSTQGMGAGARGEPCHGATDLLSDYASLIRPMGLSD